MAAKPAINWMKPRRTMSFDGSTLPSDTAVRLGSRHHLVPPSEYVVYRLLPKPFWKFWGAEREEETRFDALPDANSPATLGGRYISEPVWNLPSPPKESGSVTFRAWTDTNDAISGKLGSARMWLEETTESKWSGSEAGADAGVDLTGPGIRIGAEASRGRHLEKSWRVRVAKDPWIEISVLQADSVIRHLRMLEDEYDRAQMPHGAMRDLPAETMTYFVDRPLGDVAFTYRLKPEEPLTVALQIPDRQDLKAAISLRVRDLEDGSVATTLPIFLTHVRDRLITTDLTMDMLRPEPRDLLHMLDEAQLDVQQVAERLGYDLETTWSKLVAAAEELGANSVGEAAFFAGLSAPAIALGYPE